MAAADNPLTHRCNAFLPVCSAATTLLPLSTLTPEALVTPHHVATAASRPTASTPTTTTTTTTTTGMSNKPCATSLPPIVELGAEDLRHRLWKARRDQTPVHKDNSVYHGRTLSLAVTHADVWSVVKETRAVTRAAVDWYGWILHRHSLEAHHAQQTRTVRRALVFSADFADGFPADCPEDVIDHYDEACRCWGAVRKMAPCGQDMLKDYDIMVWPLVAKNGADWSVVTASMANDTKKAIDFDVTHYDPQGVFDPAGVAAVRNFLRLYVAMKTDPPRLEGVNFATEQVALDRPTQRHASGVMAMWVMRHALFRRGGNPLPTGSLVPRIATHLARELVADCLVVEVDAKTQVVPGPAAPAPKKGAQKGGDEEKEGEENEWAERVQTLARNSQGDELDKALAPTADVPDRILRQKRDGALTLTLTYRDLATLAAKCTDSVSESAVRWYLWRRLALRSWNRGCFKSWMCAYVIDFSTVKGIPPVGAFDIDRYDIVLFPFFDSEGGQLHISFIAILPNRAPDSSSADADGDAAKVVYFDPEEHWDRARLLRAVRLFNEYRLAQGRKETLFTVKQVTLPKSDGTSDNTRLAELLSLRLLRTAVTCERDKRDINEFRKSVMLELVRDDSAVCPASSDSQTLVKATETLPGMRAFTMKASDSLDDEDSERETGDDDEDVQPQDVPANPVPEPARPRRTDDDDDDCAQNTRLCGLIRKKPKKPKKEEKQQKEEEEEVEVAQAAQTTQRPQAPVAVPQQPPAPPAPTEPAQDESVSAPAEEEEEDDKSKHDGKKQKHHKSHKSEGKHKHKHHHKEHKSHHKHHHKKKEPEVASAVAAAKAEAAPVQDKPRVIRCQCERSVEKSPSVLTAVVVPAPAKPLVVQRVHLKKEPTATAENTTTTVQPQELGNYPELSKMNAIKLEMFVEKVRCADPYAVVATLGTTLGGVPQQCVLEARDLATFAPQTMLSVRAFEWYCCLLQGLADRGEGPVRRVIVHPDVVSQWRSTRMQRACNQLLGRTPLFKRHTDVLVPVHSGDAAWSLVVVQNGASPATTTRLCCYDPCGVQTPNDIQEVENMLQALRTGFGAEPYHGPLVRERVPMLPACVPYDPHDNAVAVLFTVRALVLGESLGMPGPLLRTFRMHAAYEIKKSTITQL